MQKKCRQLGGLASDRVTRVLVIFWLQRQHYRWQALGSRGNRQTKRQMDGGGEGEGEKRLQEISKHIKTNTFESDERILPTNTHNALLSPRESHQCIQCTHNSNDTHSQWRVGALPMHMNLSRSSSNIYPGGFSDLRWVLGNRLIAKEQLLRILCETVSSTSQA